MIPFEVFAFALAAGAVAAIVLGVRGGGGGEEVARLSGPPCPAIVRFRGNATEFEATLEWSGATLAARVRGGKLTIERKDDGVFVPHVVSSLERLAEDVDFRLEPGRMVVRIGRRLGGDEHPRFIACAYAIAQHALDLGQRGKPPVV